MEKRNLSFVFLLLIFSQAHTKKRSRMSTSSNSSQNTKARYTPIVIGKPQSGSLNFFDGTSKRKASKEELHKEELEATPNIIGEIAGTDIKNKKSAVEKTTESQAGLAAIFGAFSEKDTSDASSLAGEIQKNINGKRYSSDD